MTRVVNARTKQSANNSPSHAHARKGVNKNTTSAPRAGVTLTLQKSRGQESNRIHVSMVRERKRQTWRCVFCFVHPSTWGGALDVLHVVCSCFVPAQRSVERNAKAFSVQEASTGRANRCDLVQWALESERGIHCEPGQRESRLGAGGITLESVTRPAGPRPRSALPRRHGRPGDAGRDAIDLREFPTCDLAPRLLLLRNCRSRGSKGVERWLKGFFQVI